MLTALPAVVRTVIAGAAAAMLSAQTLVPCVADAQTSSPATLATAKKTVYVLVDPNSDKPSASILTIATASEINKAVQKRGTATSQSVAWAIPEPSWTIANLVDQCRNDPNAVGAVVLDYFAGDSTHFWLLWQTQTTTFEMSAQIVSCNRNGVTTGQEQPGAETIAIVSQLHDSNGTPWVERHTDTSVPLLSGVAVVALLSHTATKSQPTNVLTIATIGTAVLGQAFSKDIPGYSQPVRYRFDAHHVGVDVVAEIRWLCGQPESSGNLANFCGTVAL